MENGSWAIVAGYGYNNSTEQSGLLVIDVLTGNVIKNLPTGKGSGADSNGMSEVSVLDVDNDGNVDWVYGGDLHGHVWKFDLSATSASSWAIANSSQPLFSAKDGSGKRQMITGGVMANVDPKTGKAWVFFGTGRYLNQDDPSNIEQQTMYGIIDGPTVTSRSELDPRVITTLGDKRVVTYTPNLTANKKGWYMDLTDSRERIVDMPSMLAGDLMLNTTIPETNICNPSGSGYIMALNPYTGSRLKKTFYDASGDKKFDSSDKVMVSGTPTDVSGIRVGSLNSVVTFAKSGETVLALANCDGVNMCATAVNASVARQMVSWHEIAN
jgi:type IV pilus assembly protein PilY1